MTCATGVVEPGKAIQHRMSVPHGITIGIHFIISLIPAPPELVAGLGDWLKVGLADNKVVLLQTGITTVLILLC